MSSIPSTAAQVLRDGEFTRSVESNRSELARALVYEARPVPVTSPLGDYLGHALSIPMEQERLDRYFSLMVRGLWYHMRKQILPEDCKFVVSITERFYVEAAWAEMAEMGPNSIVITPDVFSCLYVMDADYPLLSRWLLLFYGTAIVEVYTIPEGLDFTPRQRHRGFGLGDSVAFTDAALGDFGDFADKLAIAKGVIKKLLPVHTTNESLVIAQIEWDQPDIPASVNVEELRRLDGFTDFRK
jgi:hypothetical protein